MKKKVMIGMSGGVDSSVAALLLIEMGYDVTGVTMRLKPDAFQTDTPQGGCCSENDIDDARKVCHKIGIDHVVLDFKNIFSKQVIEYFIDEYKKGRTPNPCIACNSEVKFKALLDKALDLGFDYIATGHYAVVEYDEELKRYVLKKSHSSKDQSYMLYGMTQHQLRHTLFPLANMEKSDVRRLAKEHDLIVANKPDSQEICFVQDKDYASFIEKYTGEKCKTGNFVDTLGNVLGEHKGIIKYTIGQRKGLGVSFGKPMYVTGIDVKKNEVILGNALDQYSTQVLVEKANIIPFDEIFQDITVQAKIRYQAKSEEAVLSQCEQDKSIILKFKEPQRAVTPGQAVVFYKNDLVVGGGIIGNLH